MAEQLTTLVLYGFFITGTDGVEGTVVLIVMLVTLVGIVTLLLALEDDEVVVVPEAINVGVVKL